MIIDMTKELKLVIPNPNIYTIELSDETLKKYNELFLKDRVANGIVHPAEELNKCPSCNRLFTENNKYCPNCGQRVRFVKSDVVPL